MGGSDWKYSWAHKFYVYPNGGTGMYKWYNTHLKDLDDETFRSFSQFLLTHTGIEFIHEEKGTIVSYAPYYGYQRA
jgi:hypothetical protein